MPQAATACELRLATTGLPEAARGCQRLPQDAEQQAAVKNLKHRRKKEKKRYRQQQQQQEERQENEQQEVDQQEKEEEEQRPTAGLQWPTPARRVFKLGSLTLATSAHPGEVPGYPMSPQGGFQPGDLVELQRGTWALL